MQRDDSSGRRDEPQIFFHLKLVGKIALAVGAAASIGLVVTLLSVSGQTGESYAEIIGSYYLTRQHLGPALLVGGLALLAVTALITWLISLYSSFRIAGPLFRFSRNLEMEIAQGPTAPIPIRKTDSLQQEHQQFKRSVEVLQTHYGRLREAAARAEAALASEDKEAWPAAAEAIARLKELDANVRL